MTSTKESKKSGTISQIIIAVAVALLAGGTSPWWWGELFGPIVEPQEKAKVWKEGILTIPINSSFGKRAADLDAATILPLGTSVPSEGVDVLFRQSVHGIVMEPGESKGDGVTFDARFVAVNDSKVGMDGCITAAVSPKVSNHLQLSSAIDVGSHICVVTTEGRMAEISITNSNLNGSPRNVEIEYVVWKEK